jgi:hypothetical protein
MKATLRILSGAAIAATLMILTASNAKADRIYLSYGVAVGGYPPPPVCCSPPPPPVVAYGAPPTVVIHHPNRWLRHHYPQWVCVTPR